ncbi:MAG: hypothetical protein OI74_15280 [Gammaproteobacteria bacterium (ex Lamellibrachia satsuma)]|nr:MAG: PilN domain-containing protein [Gammaproteobacteria bacterium (ex Lamellibrachia satsuma)]RRS31147.1 MAG: hypothetical protein OI74_15280 [Gammaproteobacteria bacterium (ex Lamellibrachia satsuma)]RRS35469.1 MAG: hypothetical protein NV67_10370 [Gammaproteobacteria bacterium (ex Lamellibrachia satsuma)]RRS37069.1 MAG: hypothetical protein NV67_03470 [Gammaproteobacteria bacterium (ex Lamellibrachia satsuma)]
MADLSRSMLASLSTEVSGFGSWWVSELTGMMPEFLKRMVLSGKIYRIEIDGEDFVARRMEKAGSSSVVVAVGRVDGRQEDNQETHLRDARKVELILPSDYILNKTLTLPKAAEENLREVISFQMKRETPFEPSQVYYDYLVTGRDKKSKTVQVTLYVAMKQQVDSLLERLRDYNVRIDQVTAEVKKGLDGKELNLIPGLKMKRGDTFSRYLNITLASVSLLLLLLNVAFPIWEKAVQLKELVPIEQQLKSYVNEARELREKVDMARRKVEFISERKTGAIPILQIIDELTRLVPDDTWIDNLQFDDEEVNIHGFSVSAASLLSLVESSDLFKHARFRSSVTQNRLNGLERFHLSAEVMGGKNR